MKREEMTHDDLFDELDRKDIEIENLECELEETQEELEIAHEMLDDIYGKAEEAGTLIEYIIDAIP